MFYKFPHIYLANVEGNVNHTKGNIIAYRKFSGKKLHVKSPIPISIQIPILADTEFTRSRNYNFDNHIDREVGVNMD